ncbi:hypothetical protein JANAI62_32780 [Jannaschia pagri]|uniref:Uncharacterized protein n=1 Tax=Jannaschia pagri TaxID=2829797 RepID=A0ABQ4NQH9_9RHOB|nr:MULTISPECIES: hypothetical protein [unclassified Jannaschia]GIT92820.1 hypothetical protein JANAI61_32780 [Jannaschia sp. AI_61]GIT96655.1 hypothetical protein JANAI62_32780 [Jannaschia sp. AI_62]
MVTEDEAARLRAALEAARHEDDGDLLIAESFDTDTLMAAEQSDAFAADAETLRVALLVQRYSAMHAEAPDEALLERLDQWMAERLPDEEAAAWDAHMASVEEPEAAVPEPTLPPTAPPVAEAPKPAPSLVAPIRATPRADPEPSAGGNRLRALFARDQTKTAAPPQTVEEGFDEAPEAVLEEEEDTQPPRRKTRRYGLLFILLLLLGLVMFVAVSTAGQPG